jgi:hypothetical protein
MEGQAATAPIAADVRRKKRRRDRTRDDFIRKRTLKWRVSRVEGEGGDDNLRYLRTSM